MPNTDNYYRDDIKERGYSPIIFDNINSVEPLPDYDNDTSNIASVENFDNIKINYNSVYIILISCLLIIFIIKKK
jgi:mRNA deadenylase 3'-5' endonuclease subunit Ccr4